MPMWRRKGGSDRSSASYEVLEARLTAVEQKLAAMVKAAKEVKAQEEGGPPADAQQGTDRVERGDMEMGPVGQQEEVPEQEAVDGKPDEEDEMDECDLGDSVWSTPVFVGLPGFGGCTSALLILTLFLSAATQVFLCMTLSSPTFNNPGYWKEQSLAAQRWRISDAHNPQYRTLGVSLVNRLCAKDEALSVATGQLDTLSNIEDYLDKPDQPWSSTGPLLAVICILLFVVVILDEQRQTFLSMRAVLSLPFGHTKLEGNRLVCISRGRLVATLLTSLLRAGIATVVLWNGVTWLANTVEAGDLILNCSALGFVFTIDEALSSAFVPDSTQTRLRSLDPVRVRRLPFHFEAVIAVLLAFGLTAAMGATHLNDQMSEMSVVKEALCGGRRNFTMALEPAGLVSLQYAEAPRTEQLPVNLLTKALEEVKGTNPLEFRSSALTSYNYSIIVPHNLFAERFGEGIACDDLQTEADPVTYHNAVREATGIHKNPFRCADYAHLCMSHELVRRTCAKTCGCRLGTGLRLFVTSGCPAPCVSEGKADAAVQTQCEDHEISSDYVKDIVAKLPPVLEDVFRRNKNLIVPSASELEASLSKGCSAEVAWLCNSLSQFVPGARTLHSFCPKLCCDSEHPDPDGICPKSCPASSLV